LLAQAIEKGKAWAVGQMQKRYPDVNVTALWDTGVTLYSQLFGGFEAIGIEDSTSQQTAGAADESQGTEAKKPDELALSAAKLLLGNLTRGSLWSALQLLPEAIAEIRATLSAQRGAEGLLGGVLDSAGRIMVGSASLVAHMMLSLLGIIAWLCIAGFSFLMQFFIFCSAMYYLLIARSSVVESLGRSLSAVVGSDELVVSIEKSVMAVFASTAKLFVFHTVFTGLVFSVFDVNLVVLSAILSGASAAFPLISPLFVCVIAVPQLLIQGRYVVLLIVFALHFFVWWTVDTAIYAEIPDSHTMTAGLGVVLGITAFGFHGVLLGPLLMCLPVIVYRWFTRTAAK